MSYDRRAAYRAWYARRPYGHRSNRDYRREDEAMITVLLRDPCAYCGAAATEVDHIDPEGEDGWANLTAVCRSCNSKKKRKPLLWFVGGYCVHGHDPTDRYLSGRCRACRRGR